MHVDVWVLMSKDDIQVLRMIFCLEEVCRSALCIKQQSEEQLMYSTTLHSHVLKTQRVQKSVLLLFLEDRLESSLVFLASVYVSFGANCLET